MKRNIIKFSILTLLASASVGCTGLLDQNDPNLITETALTDNLAAINKVNLGFYLSLPATTNWYAQSLITDELVINIAGNLGGGKQFYGWDYGPGTIADRDDTMGIFRGYYNVIRRTNLSLKNISGAPSTTNAEIILKNTLNAEALAVRAYAHYNILQLFSPKYSPTALGCAYVTSIDDTVYPSRENMQQSYAKVIKDLTDALALFPATLPAGYGGTYGNNRMTKNGVEALLVKTNLEIGSYDTAVTYANTVLSKTAITSGANLVDLWSDKNDFQEVIFKQSNIPGAGNAPGVLFYNTGGQTQYNAAAGLLAEYNPADARAALFINYGAVKGIVPGKYLFPWKNGVKSTQGVADIKLLRTADIILLKAEALVRKATPDLGGAFLEYKKLRDARTAGPSVAFTSAQDALNKIFEERARELCYESSRLTDIKRFDKVIKRNPADSRPGFTNLTLAEVFKFTLPIPQAEIFANPNIQQNTGW